ncbi:transporter substrate-binding domain-containing protein [Brucella intermedia]|uniref:transporter substrate-binding domain-containing protein n=1 Tax=Brucella intermedia TaxID=94625 RepID=UPI00224B375E|nr:transporter substrate-binding domain-containing protein [Brucella intermedia]
MTIITRTTIAAALLCASTLVARAEQVRVGISAEPYPPFTSLDASGKWVGWEIEFIDAICSEAKLDCVVTPIAWDAIIPSLTSRKIDIIMSSMSITEKRLKTIDFSEKYYSDNGYAIAAAKGTGIEPTADGLSGKVLGVQVSTNGQAYASKHFSDVVSEIKTYQTLDEITQDLAAGRIDGALASRISLSSFLKSQQGQVCCEIVGMVASDPEFDARGAGAGLRKGETALKQRIDAAIRAIRLNGKYNEITKRYFDFDIYGG